MINQKKRNIGSLKLPLYILAWNTIKQKEDDFYLKIFTFWKDLNFSFDIFSHLFIPTGIFFFVSFFISNELTMIKNFIKGRIRIKVNSNGTRHDTQLLLICFSEVIKRIASHFPR